MSKKITEKKEKKYRLITICGNCGFRNKWGVETTSDMTKNCKKCGVLFYDMPKDGLISISATARGFSQDENE